MCVCVCVCVCVRACVCVCERERTDAFGSQKRVYSPPVVIKSAKSPHRHANAVCDPVLVSNHISLSSAVLAKTEA